MFSKKYYVKEFNTPPSKLLFFSRKIFLTIFTVFLANFLFNIYFYKSDVKTAVLLNPIATQIVKTATTFITSTQNSKALENIVLNVLQKDKDDYSLVIFNMETGERYYLNEDKIYDTASLYKLWVMAVSFEQIEQGKFSQKDVLADSITSINKKFDLTPDHNESDDFVVSWPVQNALENMITVSDNNSAYLLTEKIGIQNISDFLQAQGLSESKVGTGSTNPQSSASDMAIFLERLDDGRLANKIDTEGMLNLLKQQKVNTKLSKYLPSNALIAHKTGELDSFSHDAGIVFLPKGNYIIIAMSKTSDQLAADDKIALISKGVYSYFLNK